MNGAAVAPLDRNARRNAEARSDVRERYQRVLRRYIADPETRIDPDADLGSLGIDSINAIHLLLDLEENLGISFPDHLLTPELFSTVAFLEEAIASLHGPAE